MYPFTYNDKLSHSNFLQNKISTFTANASTITVNTITPSIP
ncbi:hypothetical protein TREAZ_1646 [Leadbettera azotonutricia ZAS-9]|uniref:Uncharacterized protein n=1 Tax=Leadbettera azotonutricia (strain ATCC BAA-888 / DSM 13862 / ZAS-9) TaxID=545695 RepID=F5YDB2_LEAAZ|nr:hypothetical protein TREAZ_1646 [Leadbettera azotonutricia ZAS-9]